MQKIKRMKLVIELAQKAENDAASQLGEIQTQLQTEQQRLQDLNDYYNSYKQNANAPTGSVSVQTIQNARYFLQQLDTAKQAQTHQITHVTQQKDQQQKHLQEKYMRRRMLESLLEKIKQDEQAIVDKKEQALLDEWTSVKFNTVIQSDNGN